MSTFRTRKYQFLFFTSLTQNCTLYESLRVLLGQNSFVQSQRGKNLQVKSPSWSHRNIDHIHNIHIRGVRCLFVCGKPGGSIQWFVRKLNKTHSVYKPFVTTSSTLKQPVFSRLFGFASLEKLLSKRSCMLRSYKPTVNLFRLIILTALNIELRHIEVVWNIFTLT